MKYVLYYHNCESNVFPDLKKRLDKQSTQRIGPTQAMKHV